MTKLVILILSLLVFGLSCPPPKMLNSRRGELKNIKLPEGFHIDYFAQNVPDAKSICLGDKGTVFVGNRSGDKVYALVDEDGDFKSDKMFTIADNMNSPNGLAFYKGSLFVAEINKVWKFENIESQLALPPQPELISDAFPSDGHHGWKYIAFGPDDKLYIPVGAPCNICEREEKIYSALHRMNPDGTELELYASGIRNTVGFDWHPLTKKLYFTDNGRDMMGNDLPPCELNRIDQAGEHFGYPYCHGDNIQDPKFGDKRSCDEFTKPVQNLNAHVAPLGMLFYTGKQFPEKYYHQIILAEHGSWNRSKKSGYQLSLVELDEAGNSKNYTPFMGGLLIDQKVSGRPVDLIELRDGSVLVSDDYAEVIYRVSYQK